MKTPAWFQHAAAAMLLLAMKAPLAAQQPQTSEWNHPSSTGDWDDELKWSPVGVPTGNYHAIIKQGTVTLGQPVTIKQFTINNGGGLTGSSTLTVDGLFTANGGGLGSGLQVLAKGGMAIANTVPFAVWGRLNNAAGQTATHSGAIAIVLENGGVIENYGTFKTTGSGGITGSVGPGSFENHGLFRCESGTASNPYQITRPFDNYPLSDGIEVSNSGVLALFAGISYAPVKTAGPGFVQIRGAYTFGAGTTLEHGNVEIRTNSDAALTIAASMSCNGPLVLTSGALEVAAAATLTCTGGIQLVKGTVKGAGTLVSKASLDLGGQLGFNAVTVRNEPGSIMYLDASGYAVTMGSGAQIQNYGEWRSRGGSIQGDSGSSILNQAAAVFKLVNRDQQMTTTLGVPFHNMGLVEVPPAEFDPEGNPLSGDLEIRNGGTSPGRFVVGAGSELSMGPHVFTGTTTFEGAGKLIFLPGGTQEIPASLNIEPEFLLSGGTINLGAGAELGLKRNYVFTSGRIQGGSVLAAAGTLGTVHSVSLSGTSFAVDTGAQLDLPDNRSLNLDRGGRLENFGTFKMGRASVISSSGGGNLFENRSTVLIEAGTGSSLIQVPFNNRGTVNVKTGTLELSGGGTSGNPPPPPETQGGTFNIDAGAVLKFSAAYTFGAGTHFAGAGKLQFASGLMSVIESLATDGVDLVVGATVGLDANKTLLSTGRTTLTGGGTTGAGTLYVDDVDITATFSVGGNSTLWADQDGETTQSAPLSVLNNGRVRNSGDWNATGTGGLGGNPTGTFENDGTFTKSGAGTFPITIKFDNPGNLVVNGGGIQFGTGGSFLQLNAATKTLTGGAFTVEGGGSLNLLPGQAIEILGGSVELIGAGSSFPAINPINIIQPPGAFSISGGRDFTTTGALQVGGTLYIGPGSTFNATGAIGGSGLIHLNGTLNAALGLNLTAGAGIGGSGTVNGPVTSSGGTAEPGNSIGTLTINGPYTQTGGTLTFELDRSAAPSATADLLTATGPLTLTNSTITLKLLPGSAALHEGDALSVLQSTAGLTLTGVSIVFDPSLASYAFSQQQTGNALTFTVTKAPPALAVTAWQLNAGQVQLDFSVNPVPPGVSYSLETSTTGLTSWTTLPAAVLQALPGTGNYRYTALRSAAPAAMFRVRVNY